MMQQNNNACASTLTTSSRATTGRVVASSRVQVAVRTSSNYLRTGWLVASS